MSPDNILLRLPSEQDAYVRELFGELARRGFPPQAQSPHITVTFAPEMDSQVVARAAQVLPGLVPATFARVGTVVFGTKSKQTIAWLLEAPPELEQAARELGHLNPHGRGPRWIPHLTMGLRIPRAQVPGYIGALDELTSGHVRSLCGQVAGLWQPRLQRWTQLAGPAAGPSAGPPVDGISR